MAASRTNTATPQPTVSELIALRTDELRKEIVLLDKSDDTARRAIETNRSKIADNAVQRSVAQNTLIQLTGNVPVSRRAKIVTSAQAAVAGVATPQGTATLKRTGIVLKWTLGMTLVGFFSGLLAQWFIGILPPFAPYQTVGLWICLIAFLIWGLDLGIKKANAAYPRTT